MKKHLIILSTLVLFALCGCKQFAGDPINQDFTIEGTYTKLQVESAFEVTVSKEAAKITVTAGENVMPNVLVEKNGNTLNIHLRPLTNTYGSDLKVVLPYNADLKSVDLSGASEFHSEYGLEGDEIEVESSGASEFYCDIEANDIKLDLSGASIIESNVTAKNLDIELSGSSDATLIGNVNNLKLDLSGASNIIKTIVEKHYGLACDFCQGEISGSSEAYIHCDGTIKVNLSGASDLHFSGNAFTGDSSTSGGSNIIHDVL